MNETFARNRGKTRTTLHRVYALALAVFMLLAVTAGGAFAAAPNAGTSIGNQATATYNLNGIPQPQVSSNTVTTTVQQVAGLTLTIDQTKSVAVGGTVYFLHTVTNTGNGNDTFTLSSVVGGGTLSLTTGVFADTGSGPGAALSPAQTTTLARNASFTFYVSATASISALNGQSNTLLITATSQFNGSVSAANTDTVNLSPYAVLNFLKFATLNTGKSGDTVTYTIRYTNNGNNPATNVTITDVIPAGMTYVAGSGRWTITGATVLTDLSNADAQGTGPTITYDFGVTVANRVTAVISQVPVGATADLTFQVTVNAGLGPQVITNTAHYTYNNGNAVTPDATVTADFTINTVRTVAIDDIGSTTDTPAVSNDNVIVPSASQGGVVWFDNVIHNTGNVADTYQMSFTTPAATGSAFPAGSTIQYYDAQNGGLLGGSVTGSVAANGGTYHVWVKITLPMNTSGGPYTLSLKATSSNDGAVSDTVTDTLTTIIAAAVDMTNNESLATNANAAGKGAGPEAGAVTTTAGSNTTPAVFSLFLNNTGQTPETFAMAYSNTTNFAPAAALPAGWTVSFTGAPASGVCANGNLGAPLGGNNTAIIAGGSNAQVCAVVTPVAGAAGGVTVDVYFKATGNSTGASDVKHDAITTAKAYAITLTPNNTGTIVPNGTKVYTHTLCNNSNVTVGNIVGDLTIATTGDLSGWSSIIYADAGLSTILSDVHQLNGGTGLPAGACMTIYVKVGAPAGPLGAVDTTTINVTSLKPASHIVATANDTTTMSLALTIDKSQALDPTCNTAPASLIYTTGNLTAGANPGVCIAYRLVVNNIGSQQATLVSVSDALTPYTAYSKGATCFPFGSAGAIPASGNIDGTGLAANQINEPAECATGGTVTFGPTGHELTLNAGSIATLYFRVQIQK